MLRALVILSCACFAAAAQNDARLAASVARMQASIEKQRVSVARQAPAAPAAGFFTTGWLSSAQTMAPNVEAACDPLEPEQLRKLIATAATAESVNPLLLGAMVRQESGGRPCAVSRKGAQGLMQIIPSTAAELGLTDPFDPAASISAGARYIKQLLSRYKGDLRLALAAYNAGSLRVDADRDVPPIAETQAYVSGILATLQTANEAVAGK